MQYKKTLRDLVEVNSDFENAVNLYLSLNKKEKINSYIPTKSSVGMLLEYLESVENKNENATLLIGPYGKGKTHLILVLLAILSMDRNNKNKETIEKLKEKIEKIDGIGGQVCSVIDDVWTKDKFLPIIVMPSQDDLAQSFLVALNDALKREGLDDIKPDTYFSHAIKAIENWESKYLTTKKLFENELKKQNTTIGAFKKKLSSFDRDALEFFINIFPELTSGSQFNPLASSEVLPLYKNTCEILSHDYGYRGIYIVFDEFSKFIEGQDEYSTGMNMKILQDLCELSASMKNGQMHITMIAHKNIKEYGDYLPKSIINSFTGIEGRISEKYFYTSSKNNYELIQNAIVKAKGYENNVPDPYLNDERKDYIFKELDIFNTIFKKADFEKIVYKGCYPLSPISAYLLLSISEKVAQNERTLFTFISKDEPNSMIRFINENPNEWIVNAEVIYDYFVPLFKKDISNEYVHNEWLNADYAIKKANSEEEKRVLKALALISIVNREDELPAKMRLIELASGAKNVKDTLLDLETKGLVYKKGSNEQYSFKTRAGAELKKEIKHQMTMNSDINISDIFSMISDSKYIIPRKYNIDMKMTRYFEREFIDTVNILGLNDSAVLTEGCCADGKVVYLYNTNGSDDTNKVRNWIKNNSSEDIIYVYSTKKVSFVNKLKEYYAIQVLNEDNSFTEKYAVYKNELSILEEDLGKEIKDYMREIFSDDNSKVYYKYNERVCSKNTSELDSVIDKILGSIFTKTPIINNEIVNRNVISTSATKKARERIVSHLLKGDIDESYYSGTNQEASIFRSVFVVTKLWENNPEKELKNVISNISKFVNKCCDKKVSMTTLIDKLTSKPIGLRKGLIPFYVAYVLGQRNDDIVIYFQSLEKVVDAQTVIDMCEQPEEYWLFISKESAQKEEYISKLQKMFWVDKTNVSKEKRILELFSSLQRWYNGLPQITRVTKDFEDYPSAKNVKEYLGGFKKSLQAINTNPYEKLFVEIPSIFSDPISYDKTLKNIEKCKNCLKEHFDWVIEKTIKETISIFGGTSKDTLHHILKNWYDDQSDISKKGLYSGRITSVMTCISDINNYNDKEIIQKLVKASTDVYMDTWNSDSFDDYINQIVSIKTEVENIGDTGDSSKCELVFVGKDNKTIKKYYEKIDSDEGFLFRNMLEGTLEDFEDMSVNDKVAIMLEMIEKIL